MTDVTPSGKVHPAAVLFPLLDDEELAELAEDVATHGLRQPVTLDREGTLLDGRNRLGACQIAGVEPSFTVYEGDDLVAFVLSANTQRRHLSKGQRAMLVVQAKLLVSNNLTQAELATAAGLESRASVAQAAVVAKHAPDLVDAVSAGTLPLNTAYTIAKQRKDPDVLEATLELSCITLNEECRQRRGHPETIAAYARAYRRGDQFPPLEIVNIDGSLCLVDGWMRFEALTQIGAETASCRIKRGTIIDAYEVAAGANSKHGKRATVEDRRLQVAIGLSGVSDRAIGGYDLAALRAVITRELRTVESVEDAWYEVCREGFGDDIIPATAEQFTTWLSTKLTRWAAAT